MDRAEVRRWFGRQMMQRRLRMGLTQHSLGQLVGLSQAQVCRAERGMRGVPVEVAWALARTFGCTVDELLRPPPGRRLPGADQAGLEPMR